jgi:hypothetical protein
LASADLGGMISAKPVLDHQADGGLRRGSGVRVIAGDDLVRALKEEMKRHAVPIERIGSAGLVLPVALATFAFDIVKQGAQRVCRLDRRRKYPDEIESCVQGDAIAEQGYEHLLKNSPCWPSSSVT